MNAQIIIVRTSWSVGLDCAWIFNGIACGLSLGFRIHVDRVGFRISLITVKCQCSVQWRRL